MQNVKSSRLLLLLLLLLLLDFLLTVVWKREKQQKIEQIRFMIFFENYYFPPHSKERENSPLPDLNIGDFHKVKHICSDADIKCDRSDLFRYGKTRLT